MNRYDRKRIKSAVLDTLQEYGKPLALPLPIKAIVKHFENIRLIPYSKQMQRYGLTYNEMLDFTGTDDACTDYDANSGLYIIYYNDCDTKKIDNNRYRWNIAHELGHVRLGHHKHYPDSKLFRNRLSAETYKDLESEADMFAAYILVPHIVLSCLEVTSDREIAKLCRVSDTASSYRESDMKLWRERKKLQEYDFLILSHFADYVELKQENPKVYEWLLTHRACKFCGGVLPSFSHTFCSFCGANVAQKYLSRRSLMQYSGIKVDDLGRAEECPNCHNTEVYESGHFCVICGCRIINVCSQSTPETQFRPTCTHNDPLPGNARYCPYCGAKTTFFESKFIDSWNGEDDSDDLPF